MTSDIQQSKVLPAYFHLWNKYFNGLPHSRIVCGFTHFPCDARFYSIGKFEDYPANKWSDALLNVLDNVADEIFILMLDDYWLIRQVNTRAIQMISDYMHQFKNVIKFDLAYDRLGAWGADLHYDTLGYLDLVKSNHQSQYHMSLWGGMWRRDLLKEVLVSGETAQQIELNGTHRLAQRGDEVLVLGTRQAPLLHANVIQRQEWNQDAQASGLPAIKESDKEELKNLGYLPEHYS